MRGFSEAELLNFKFSVFNNFREIVNCIEEASDFLDIPFENETKVQFLKASETTVTHFSAENASCLPIVIPPDKIRAKN